MNGIRRFLGDETGTVTIDFLLWVPMFIMLFVLVTDASIIYLTHSEMWSAARDTVRRMTTGEITSRSEAQDFAASRLFLGDRTYVIEPSSFGNEMNVTIVVGIDGAAVFGYFFKSILGKSLVASVTMRKERHLVPVS